MNSFLRQVAIILLFVSFYTQRASAQTYINMPANLAADIINSSPFVPTPYYSYHDNVRYQFIYTRDELIAGGAPSDTGCFITSLAWHIVRLINAPYYATGSGLKGYTIRMRNVPVDLIHIGDTIRTIGPEFTVKNPFNLNQSVVSDTGYTDLVFDQEFAWDGVGNIMIDVCYGINDGVTAAPLGIFSNVNSGVAALSYFGQPDTGRVGIGTFFVTPSAAVCDTFGNGMYWFIPRPVSKLGFRPFAPACKPRILPEQPEVCAGNSIQLSVTGAESYIWSHPSLLNCSSCENPTVSPTRDTTLKVIGQKGSCRDSAYVYINVKEPAGISITRNPDVNNLCNGPIQLSIPQDFTNIQWSTASNDTFIVVNNPGSYEVTATDSLGCIVTSDPMEIIRTTAAEVDILPQGDLYLCGGPIVLSGTPGLTEFSWTGGASTPTITVSAPGSFVLHAVDANGCAGSSDTTKVFPGQTPEVPIMTKDTLICEGHEAVIESVNAFARYQWSNGDTTRNARINQPGDYYLTITDVSGCQATSDTLHFTQNYVPVANFTYGQPFFNYSVQFTSTSQYGRKFFWDFGGGNTSNEENPIFTYPFDDTYPVTLIVTNDCGNDTINMDIIVKKLLGIHDPGFGLSWEILPNPASDYVILKLGEQAELLSRLELYNYAGQLVYTTALQMSGQGQKQVSVSEFAAGAYWVVLYNRNQQREIKRLVIH